MIQELGNVNWGNWIPIIISAIALIVTIIGHRNKAKRNELDDLKEKIKMAEDETIRTKEALKSVEQENQMLRRDKLALLERIAAIGSVRESDRKE